MLSLKYSGIIWGLAMPVFKDFSENGEFLSTHNEPLNSKNLERYLHENNVERAMGYADAIRDFISHLEACLIKQKIKNEHGYGTIYHPETKIMRSVMNLSQESHNLLDELDKQISVVFPNDSNKCPIDQNTCD